MSQLAEVAGDRKRRVDEDLSRVELDGRKDQDMAMMTILLHNMAVGNKEVPRQAERHEHWLSVP